MNNAIRAFYVPVFLIFVLTSAIISILDFYGTTWISSPTVWISQVFIFVITLVSHWISSKGLKNKAIDFHIFYMGSMGLRFLLSVFYIFLIVYLHPANTWAFVIDFFLLYFIYTSFEIYSLLANLRAENQKE